MHTSSIVPAMPAAELLQMCMAQAGLPGALGAAVQVVAIAD